MQKTLRGRPGRGVLRMAWPTVKGGRVPCVRRTGGQSRQGWKTKPSRLRQRRDVFHAPAKPQAPGGFPLGNLQGATKRRSHLRTRRAGLRVERGRRRLPVGQGGALAGAETCWNRVQTRPPGTPLMPSCLCFSTKGKGRDWMGLCVFVADNLA